MQPISFGAMLLAKNSNNETIYINPKQVVLVGEDKKGTTYIQTSNNKTITFREDYLPERLIQALHNAEQATDKPFLSFLA